MYPLPEFVDEGGLIAYSFDLIELNRRVYAFTEPELPNDFVVDIRARGDWD
jgi:hypothetical protein